MQLNDILDKIRTLPLDQQQEMLSLLEKLSDTKEKEDAKLHFLSFVKRMWPDFIGGSHHKLMAEAFERIMDGKTKRLIINMPPRHTKSEFASYLLPAWFMGRYPNKKIIQSTHTAELAVGFGRKTRNLINSAEYQDLFPDTQLMADSKASGRWSTSKGGEYFAIGVGGAIAGKGADLFIIDDPHTEQEALMAASDPKVYDKVFEWYTSGPRQRLQPDARIVIVMTRWGKRDLTGQLIQSSISRGSGDEWEVIELPAILPSGNALWPEFWSLEALEALKEELPAPKWNAQYQQKPTNEEGAILKREWWNIWEKERPPEVNYIMITADTAFTTSNRADYSAFSVWGIFDYENPQTGSVIPNIILLDAIKERIEFPELKQRAKELNSQWNPDTFMIEAKASGLPLIHELRQAGLIVSEFTPTRASGDKIMRANSISDIFSSGVVWAPNRNWAKELIEECAEFPNGEHDDYVDTVIMALMRYRHGGFLQLDSDEADDDLPPRRAVAYY